MLTVCTWLWGDKFGSEYVDRLRAGVDRHLKQPHRFVVFSPSEEDGHLIEIKGCFARLRMLSPEWQRANGIDERLVCIDLDTVITGPLDPLFNRPENFVIMQGGNASNPCPYNGALMMLRAGAHSDVWSDFDLSTELSWVPGEASPIERPNYYEFPDDQGWIAHKIPKAAGWKCGAQSGVYVFRKPGWPGFKRKRDIKPEDHLPEGARLVTFSGGRKPEAFTHLRWVRENWR